MSELKFSSGILFIFLLTLAVPAFADEVSALQGEFLQGRYEKVLEGTERALKFSARSRADELLYLQGASALKMRRLETARESLERLIGKYSESPRIPEAKLLMERLTEIQKPAEPTARPADVPSAADSVFAVQVGAFASEKNALKLKTELDRRGYPTSITSTADSGGTLYRVRVGRYGRRAEAERQADKLHAEGFPAKVVP